MAISPSWPGVYVQEVPSGVRTIAGVSTSVALFVGFTRSGAVNTPILCTSYSDYVRAFGEDVTAGDMTRQVRLFFLNGGTQCYIVRVAEGATPAAITLRAEDGVTAVLTLSARSAGTQGDLIRAAVTYNGSQPEDTFNLELFRWDALPNGSLIARDAEVWRGLSMDPDSGSYAPAVLDSNSRLVTATAPAGTASTARSYAMRAFTAGSGHTEIAAEVAGANQVQMSINGSVYVAVSLPETDEGSEAGYATAVEAAIAAGYAARGLPAPTGVTADWETAGTSARLFVESTNGNVFVRRGTTADAALTLMWGTEQAGLEITRYAHERPAATGVTLTNPDFAFFQDLVDAATGTSTITLNKFDATGALVPAEVSASFVAGTPLLDILGALRAAVVAGPPAAAVASLTTLGPGESWPWTAELWGYRLAILATNGPGPAGSDDNRVSGFGWADDGTPSEVDNVRYYSLGTTGTGSFQTAGTPGADGTAPTTTALYDQAYEVVRSDVDLFNLMVLPRSADESVIALEDLWANASVFCEQSRALLLMEPPEDWTGVQQPANEVASLRIGLSRQYAALYYPRVTVQEGRLRVDVGATGAIAGLMARIDSARGVWKAPAGTEADLRGIVGVSELLSDRENGVINPRAINAIRSFPNGIVSWGARTMDGDDGFASEYKYVPVRRLALYLEESLYRGLQWVVFEPNDEPLWAQIRLNVGAFMQGLFRQGAFQGRTPLEAYFVKCDAETTTQNDRNLGIVNVWVGFAPLKPAEFVILTLQQMAGQVQV